MSNEVKTLTVAELIAARNELAKNLTESGYLTPDVIEMTVNAQYPLPDGAEMRERVRANVETLLTAASADLKAVTAGQRIRLNITFDGDEITVTAATPKGAKRTRSSNAWEGMVAKIKVDGKVRYMKTAVSAARALGIPQHLHKTTGRPVSHNYTPDVESHPGFQGLIAQDAKECNGKTETVTKEQAGWK